MTDWRCPACGAMNAEADAMCEHCATAPLWTQPPSARWALRCPEPHCGKTVGEHRDEIRAQLARITARRP
jgi:hypothetical protein